VEINCLIFTLRFAFVGLAVLFLGLLALERFRLHFASNARFYTTLLFLAAVVSTLLSRLSYDASFVRARSVDIFRILSYFFSRVCSLITSFDLRLPLFSLSRWLVTLAFALSMPSCSTSSPSSFSALLVSDSPSTYA
jgi:hypothetical protein